MRAILAKSGLGPYEVLSPLGAGGFGKVFKARDTRLGRTVAIKVFVNAIVTLHACGECVPLLYGEVAEGDCNEDRTIPVRNS